jgi:hypothetical protein
VKKRSTRPSTIRYPALSPLSSLPFNGDTCSTRANKRPTAMNIDDIEAR